MKKQAEKTQQEKSPPERILLHVTNYGLNVIACLSDAPLKYPKIQDSTALIKIEGISKPAGWKFWVYAYPNGSRLEPAFLRENEKKVQMAVHQSQVASIMAVLTDGDDAHAVYSVDKDGTVYSDVHGEFTKRPKSAPADPSKPKRKSKD